MNVVMPVVASARHLSGVQRHAVNVARSLLLSPEITALRLIAAPWQTYLREILPDDPRLELLFPPVGESVWSRNRWYYAELPAMCRMADVVHLSYPVPVKRNAFPCPIVTSLHDMYPFDLPQNFGYIKSYFQRAMLRSCLHTVDAAACVSHSTLARLEAFEPGIALIKATVIPNAVEPMQAASSKVPPRPYAEPFLLCVAQHRRNKQIPLLLKIFVELLHTESVDRSAQLIVVGIPGPETHAIHKCIQRYGLQARVRLVMGLTDEQMQAHYQHCEVLIAPSSIEGFGLPIVEGLMAGCRVVCSDIAAFREVGNASCTYVPLDLDVVHRFAEAIMQSLGKPKPQPVAPVGFSLSAVSSEYVRLYQKLNEQHVRPRIPGNIAFATTKTRTGAEA